MTIRMSRAYKDILLAELTREAETKNPFIKDGDKTYMRYDMIILSGSKLGEVIIQFYWKSNHILNRTIDGVMGLEISITLHDIEGRVEISFL
jgi:hypothetical protein